MPTLLLVDGHSQAYRAFFGVKTPLTTRQGEPTAAVYGFARKLLSVLKEYKPACAAVAFDLGDTWRHAEFADYKATRDRMPDEMRVQMLRIEQLLRAFNIPIVTCPNFEADDVLGTLARQAAQQGHDVLILSGDRDMFQLIDDRVRILYTSGGPNPLTSIFGMDEFSARYGLRPDQFVDYKALVGDSSDNIPGVEGVGEKTAIKLILEYGSVEGIYASLEKIKGPKLQQALGDRHERVQLNQRIMRIATDLKDVHFDPVRCETRDYDPSAVIELFNELEFRSLIKELPDTGRSLITTADGVAAATDPVTVTSLPPDAKGPAVGSAQSEEQGAGQMALFAFENDEAVGGEPGLEVILPGLVSDYLVVNSTERLQQLVEALAGAAQLSFDVETTSRHAMDASLVGLGVAWAAGQAAYIPLAHVSGVQLPWSVVKQAIQPTFADAALPKMAHNGKYDLTVLLENGLQVAGPIHDTMVLAWILDPASRMLGLKAQASIELNWQMVEIAALIGTGKKQITIDQAPIETVAAYCGSDVDATLQLFAKLAPRVREQGMWALYEEIELPLLPVLTDMERTGVLIDPAYLAVMSEKLGTRLRELERELIGYVGREFNLRSTQQMSNVLFGDLGFPTKGITRTSSGHFSTAVSELEKLRTNSATLTEDQRKVLDCIFEQRQLEKLRGTYVDNLPLLVNPRTGRIHTSFSQTGAVTGRMSSSDPNLQNIPIRTDLGREIRRAFTVPPGHLLLSADYSQVELRVMAHVAQEPAMIEAFRADADIHAATAAHLFNVPIEQVTKAQRNLGKTINFATIYGSSAYGISSRTDLDPLQARQFLEQYFVTYPRIRAWLDATKAQAQQEGYVSTLLGRKRNFPELANPALPMNQRMALERQAINAPIQGAAADIMKIAMVRLHAELKARGLRSRMLLQVHDELVLEAPFAERDEVAALVRDVMSSAYALDVPLKVDVEVGPNWYDLEPA